LPDNERFSNTGRHAVAISPDDAHIVYGANGQLNIRRLDQLVATPIRGTEGPLTSLVESARNPFFSPDGEWIGFWQNNQLKKVSVNGGAAVVLCAADNPWGASWSADDSIVFGQGPKGIMRVAAAGGSPELVVKVDSGESAHGPQMLPGERAILFTLRPPDAQTWDESRIVVQSLATGERKEVIKPGSDARYLPTGHLVYALESTVLAVPFDVDNLSVTGGPVPVLEMVARAGGIATGAAHFSVSARGTLVGIEDTGQLAAANRTLTWVDRNGRETPIKAPAQAYQDPRLSADGQRIAIDTNDGQRDVWIWNLAGETLTRLTLESSTETYGLWTPDGRRELFFMTLQGEALMAAAILASTGNAAFKSATPVKLFDTRGYFAPTGGANQRDPGRTYDVSADGRFLMLKDVSVREGTSARQSITVILNWVEELKRLVPRN
jgi:serine/threonine-protein kinase